MLSVFLFHFDGNRFANGYLGVNLFFLISGYVMCPKITYIFSTKLFDKSKLFNFYRKRFYRLYPAFMFTLILNLVLLFPFTLISEQNRVLKQSLFSYFGIGNIGAYKFANNYFHPNELPVIHYWSLSTEIQIYILVPLFLLMSLTFVNRSTSKGYSIFFICFGILSFLINIYLQKNPFLLHKLGVVDISGFLFYLPSNHIWEFCLGALIYQFKSSMLNRNINFQINPLAHIILIPTGLFLLFSKFNSIKYLQITIIIIFALILIVNSFKKLPKQLKFLLEWLGDRSYSLYLVHLPIIFVICKSYILTTLPIAIKFLCSFILSLIVANVSFRKVENRFRKLNTLSTKNSKLSFVVFLLLPLIVITTLFPLSGKTFRESKNNLPTAAYDFDPNCGRLSVKLCNYISPKSKKSAILIGDSHAGVFAELFVKTANLNNVSASTFLWRGCPIISENFLPKDSNFKTSPRLQLCTSIINSVEKILKSNSFDFIFMSNNCEYCSKQETEANMKTVLNLAQNTRKSFFIGQTPIFDERVQMGAYPFKKFYEYNSVEESHVLNKIKDQIKIEDMLLSSKNVQYIDSMQILCPNLCQLKIENKYTFIDNNHLSTNGALLYLKTFSEIFE